MNQLPLNNSSVTIQLAKDRENAQFEGKTESMENHYNRLWTIHKKNLSLEEKKLFQKQSEEIISKLENDNKENSSPFEFAVELNKPLTAARNTYIIKFKWLLTTIEIEIKDTETKGTDI